MTNMSLEQAENNPSLIIKVIKVKLKVTECIFAVPILITIIINKYYFGIYLQKFSPNDPNVIIKAS